MTLYLDINHKSLNKQGEELCGDHVEIVTAQGKTVLVLSDGLGSGVKANILATLTSKIATTMLKNGASLRDTVETILNTLPKCQVRQLAYSTFTIVIIDDCQHAYIAECDNPALFFYRHGRNVPLQRKEIKLSEKKILESHIQLQEGDMLSVVSDGAVHAGVGAMLNLGWAWEDINEYLKNLHVVNKTASQLNGNFLGVCNNLYNGTPGDDTTILTIKATRPKEVDLFTGPPEDVRLDKKFTEKMTENNGRKKVICGGTTAIIASRELKREIEVDNDTIQRDIPPIAYIEGFDLVTEGVLTLGKVLDRIRYYNMDAYGYENTSYQYNGVDLLTKVLMEECTHVYLHIGKAVNPAHQNPDFPMTYNIKFKILESLIAELEKCGKQVTRIYY